MARGVKSIDSRSGGARVKVGQTQGDVGRAVRTQRMRDAGKIRVWATCEQITDDC